MAAAGSPACPVTFPSTAGPAKHTQSPIVTGTSVLAVKYAGGVMLAADTLGSYGSLARFFDLQRIHVIGGNTLVGASGEFSDFQYILDMLNDAARAEKIRHGHVETDAHEIHSYLTRVLYQRRMKMDPLWNSLVVAGVVGGKPYLGIVDLRGTSFTEDYIATGLGSHMAIPLMRERWHADMTEGEARTLLEDCLRVCFYRDCNALNKYQLAKVEESTKPVVSEPMKLETKWDFKSFIAPKAGTDTDGSW